MIARVLFATAAILSAPSVYSADAPLTAKTFRVFVAKHCSGCHGADKQEGDVRFDTLPLSDSKAEHLEIWRKALQQVADLDMPPEDALTKGQIDQFTGFLTPMINKELASVSRGKTQLRRLNKIQYSNTVRDLFGINITVEDPAAPLPPDEESDGFDNLGSVLTVSDIHLDAYLSAAADVVSRWADRAAAVPESFRVEVPSPPDVKRKIGYGRGTPWTDEYFDLMHSAWTNRRFKTFTFPARDNHNCLLPHGGVYRITVDAEAMHTDDPRGAEILSQLKLPWQPDQSQTPQFGFFLRRPLRSITPNIDQRVATFELGHGQRAKMTQEVWLPGGQYTLAINFDTGPRFDPAQTASRLWAAKLSDGKWSGDVFDAEYDKAMESLKRRHDSAPAILDNIMTQPLPRIRFHSIVIEGPLRDPSAPTQDYLTRVDEDSAFQHRELRRFARRIFRRPVSDEELAPYVAYAKQKGFQATLKAMLCSPSFLYFHETTDQLDDFALANRLSYFLWNSLPDDRLFALAARGQLTSPAVLRKEADRMLRDKKAQSFLACFTHQWLGLGNMDDMPAASRYIYYHDFFVRDLFKKETTTFFGHLLMTNSAAADLVHADYSFMNAPLARYYGIEGVSGSAFQRVSLAGLPNRRGLFGQGAVLTTSANGIDTSPVIRGIWVLEHLLGTPPSPPPPNVEVLEPDTRGTVSIREMYEAHRNDSSCKRCHEDIDPLGFALENFDPVGQWRDTYESGLKVDAWGQMPDGRKFEDINGLRNLFDQKQMRLIAHHLLDRFLVCATGRKMTVTDQQEIDTILDEAEADGYRLKDLLQSAVASQIFSRK